MSTPQDNDDNNNDNDVDNPLEDDRLATTKEEGQETENSNKKFHWMTVCMVPPDDGTSSSQAVWDTVQDMRKRLRDPGLYRWPPHANLLYPFLNVTTVTQDSAMLLDRLAAVTASISPFTVSLNRLGTFGGKRRGVLWLYPHSSRKNAEGQDDVEPLIQLQALLQDAFPECSDQQKFGTFHPHMTLSHFESLETAMEAQRMLEDEVDQAQQAAKLTFPVNCIYVLRREGDDGQFQRVATLGLGQAAHNNNNSSETITIHNPPLRFSSMPLEEEDWVRNERMQLKGRRRNNQRRRGRGRSSSSPRKVDTVEEIIAKRAERQAKRLAREREEAATQSTSEDT